jgi:hypothetical protein
MGIQEWDDITMKGFKAKLSKGGWVPLLPGGY